MKPPRATRTGTAQRRVPVAVAVALLLTAGAPRAAWPGGHDDHERARAAVRAGEVLPLPLLLERLQRTHPGQVLELELEREHGRWIYEVRLLQPGGRLLKLEVDALTAQVLGAGRRRDGAPSGADAMSGPDARATR